jgi:hypothetical protein
MKKNTNSSKPARTIGTARQIVLVTGGALLAAISVTPASAGSGNKIPCDLAGPQAPRDITNAAGTNPVSFAVAPPAAEMHLCDIHFHRYAEHRASGYTQIAGEGDHKGYVCEGATPKAAHGESHGEGQGCAGIAPGDTIEVHWVLTTCDVKPGPTLGTCFSDTCKNPQLRVEARVFNLTDDGSGADFASFRASSSGTVTLPEAHNPVQYLGSTTGPSYNDGSCSPFQVTWNVASACAPLEIASINNWCGTDKNPFEEDHAHGVRRLVTDEALLSPIN